MTQNQATNLNKQQQANTSTTNNLILDHLFYQSIQSRLQKAFSFEEEPDKKNVIESVIEGFLSSNKLDTKSDKRKLNPKFEQRLNLCQLTNLTIGRTNHVTFSTPLIINPRRIEEQHPLYSKPFTPLYCKRHRNPNCQRCSSYQHGPGLSEAIPCFLKTSAHKLRSVLDANHHDIRPLFVAGQPVMGGGMPPRWYDLFLDLLTQAAIQAYMCDGKTGLETIYEIFSYGYVEDEEEEDFIDEDDEEEEDEEEDNDDVWHVKAADHHLLFPKTRTMYLFKLQVRKREKEFIEIKEGYTLEQHFKELEKLYPLYLFERNMCDFIQMILEDMDIPALDKCDIPDIASPIKSPEDLPEIHIDLPSLYKYPEDGSILMPEIPDINYGEEEDTIPTSKKRPALNFEDDHRTKHIRFS